MNQPPNREVVMERPAGNAEPQLGMKHTGGSADLGLGVPSGEAFGAAATVPPGYKLTEVGVIPEDWEIKRIEDLALVGAGGTPSRTISDYWNGAIPWITTSQIDFGPISDADEFITEAGLNNSATKLLPVGTLLLALYGQGKTRGKVGVLNFEATTNQACASISIKADISHDFLLHFLISRYDAIRNSSNSGSQENLNSKIVKNISVALPTTKAEQKAIAEALSDADALIEALEQLVVKKRQLKQGAMQELLTGKRRLPGFQGGWHEITLGDLIKVQAGFSFSSINFNDIGIPVLRISDISGGNVRIDDAVCHPKIEISDDFIVRKGDYLIAMSGATTGKVGCYRYNSVAYLNQRVGRFIINDKDKTSPYYIGQLISSVIFNLQLKALLEQGAQPNISTKQIESLSFYFPRDCFEQTAIAQILTDMDAEITGLESKLAKARAVKQGMMQQLLTGRIRLP